MALGEADAELAWLSKEGYIDAVASEDSDLIVLGAVVVLRNFLHEDNDEKVTVYCAEAIRKHAALGFTDTDFLVIALLVGGDYDDGLKRCGIRIATGLARAGLGHRLLHGLSQSKAADNFLEVWRNELREELRTNDSGHLPSCQPALSNSVPSDFPQLKVINLYRNPLSSKTNPTDLLGCSPNPILLAIFSEENFCWGSTHGILSHFETTIFPGLALDDICRIARETDLGLAKRPCQFIGEVLQRRVPLKARDCPRHPEVKLSLIVSDALVDSIIGSLLGKLNDGETEGRVNEWQLSVFPRMRVWLPIAMIHATFPELIVAAGKKKATRCACMSTGGKAPRASGSMGMPRPLKQKSREDDGAASSSKRPKHNKIVSSTDHFDTINLTTPKPNVLTNKQWNCHNVIDALDLTQSDLEPVTGIPERRYHLDVSDDGHLIEFITDSEGEL
ncbi:uncharacterized protein LACBIDRAFT_309403 [Laccaria bicolor S238N-H82]|uniref:Predicted protein n=1 Tax=Laccaria bicolor (strain S238N-H82 / ATCC MYA-4686) TaxID=486041 RepID=B0DS82_LACBS|nr:uncharacterized protein LACBIDRAFT_309403 [Laccaria bicolor S238N-H82]EDR02503.1 predicted protein [Laccaria bicolor S238N-H82]|eukprot:XP_001886866.1 predicted protein [Laccaria bicolor S238N-H82]